MPSFPLEVKTGRGHSRHWKKIEGWENQDNDEIIPSEKTKRRDVG